MIFNVSIHCSDFYFITNIEILSPNFLIHFVVDIWKIVFTIKLHSYTLIQTMIKHFLELIYIQISADIHHLKSKIKFKKKKPLRL